MDKRYLRLPQNGIPIKWKNQKHAYTQLDLKVQDVEIKKVETIKEYSNKLIGVVNKVILLGKDLTSLKYISNVLYAPNINLNLLGVPQLVE